MFYKDAVYWYLANVLGITDEFDKWRFEFYIIAIDTTGSNEIRVFRLDSSQVCSRNDVINDAMTEIAWHMDKIYGNMVMSIMLETVVKL